MSLDGERRWLDSEAVENERLSAAQIECWRERGALLVHNLLPRTLIAKDCNALRSSYYVPASWSQKTPNELFVAIEVVASVIEVNLHRIDPGTGKVLDENAIAMDCVPSSRIPGFECTKRIAELADVEDTPSSALELVLKVFDGTTADADITKARLTVPTYTSPVPAQ